MERKLATVQVIEDILPIEGRDRIVLARVLGWYVIVQKDLYQIGDYVVFFEVDSMLPVDDKRHADLIKYTKGTGRIKTIKMAGVISQGYCMPYSKLALSEIHIAGNPCKLGYLPVDTDLTDVLNVKKYETDLDNVPSPNNKSGGNLRNFPSFVRKTDETRVQKLAAMIRALQGEEVYITEKLDGSSMTLVWTKDRKFMVCSRNKELRLRTSLKPWYRYILKWFFKPEKNPEGNPHKSPFWQFVVEQGLDSKYVMDMMLHYYPKGVAVQGELIGPSRNGNKHKLQHHEFHIFSVFDIETQKYRGYHEVRLISERLNLPMVPVLNINVPLNESIDELVAMAAGKSRVGDLKHREGIVIRTMDGQHSMKAINPNFLLKEEK